MAQGKKNCPNCNTELGARTHLCGCGWHYPTQSIRKDLLEEKKVIIPNQIYDSLKQGRKKCPGCGVIIGATIKTCFKCGFDFIAAKKERDEKDEALREEKRKLKAVEKEEKEKIRQEMREKQSAKTVKRDSISPRIAKLLAEVGTYVAPPKITKKGHAKRILKIGVERAGMLLRLHDSHNYWSHVDWEIVRSNI